MRKSLALLTVAVLILAGCNAAAPAPATASAGTAVSIIGSISSKTGQVDSHYLQPGDEWLYCMVELEPHSGRFAYVRRCAVTYDAALEYRTIE